MPTGSPRLYIAWTAAAALLDAPAVADLSPYDVCIARADGKSSFQFAGVAEEKP